MSLDAIDLVRGKFCFLTTDLANHTANSIYRKIGYEPVCDYAQYRFAATAAVEGE